MPGKVSGNNERYWSTMDITAV